MYCLLLGSCRLSVAAATAAELGRTEEDEARDEGPMRAERTKVEELHDNQGNTYRQSTFFLERIRYRNSLRAEVGFFWLFFCFVSGGKRGKLTTRVHVRFTYPQSGMSTRILPDTRKRFFSGKKSGFLIPETHPVC
jgi:hypothetical protein